MAGELGYPATLAQIQDRLARLATDAQQHVAVYEAQGQMLAWMQLQTGLSLASGVQAEIMALVVAAADGNTRGAFLLDGRMVDLPFLKRAQALLAAHP